MKKFLFLIVITMLMTAIPVSVSFSQVVGDGKTALIIGGRYEAETYGTYGLGLNVGGPLWQVTTLDIVDDPAVNIELIALFKLPIGKTFYGGFVSGVQTMWLDMPEDAPFINYLQGATGLTMAYGFNDYVGVGGYLKRTYPLDDNALETAWVGGLAFYLRL